MTNDTTHAMPTVEEINELADLVGSTCWGEESRHDAAIMLRAIADHLSKSKPVAYATHHEPPMVFTEIDEAWSYCEDDESPLPLYTTPLADAEDARRYRWLRENTRDSFDGSPHILSWHTGCNYVYSGEAADKAIDAYMKESGNDHPTD